MESLNEINEGIEKKNKKKQLKGCGGCLFPKYTFHGFFRLRPQKGRILVKHQLIPSKQSRQTNIEKGRKRITGADE